MSVTRNILVSVALLAVAALAAAVAAIPWVKADKPGIAVFFLLVFALAVSRREMWQRPSWLMLAIMLAGLAMIPPSVIARGFGRIDMMAILFHTDFGVAGAGLGGLETEILQSTLAITLLLFAIYGLLSIWRPGTWLYLVIAVSLFAMNPLTHYAALRWLVPPIPSDLVDYMAPVVETPASPQDPDIVLIYLEGSDRQFADTDVWGDVYAPLSRLAAEGISLTRVRQISGTGWSIAGMMASLCGVPAVPNGLVYRNNYDAVSEFMPNITCLGDVLSRRGYDLSYVVGGELAFGGLDKFYGQHGFTDMTGLDEQRAFYSPKEFDAALIDWILDDQMVFDTARRELEDRLALPGPFAMVVETVGPHGRNGWLSRKCSDTGRGVKSTDARRVMACTFADTEAFISDLRRRHAQTRPDRGLRLIVMSDHLSHNPKTPPVAPEFRDANTVLLIGAGGAGRTVTKEGAMIDVFPTLLEWLGFSGSPAANLGRSLLSEQQTVIESHGKHRLNAMLTDDAALSNLIWD